MTAVTGDSASAPVESARLRLPSLTRYVPWWGIGLAVLVTVICLAAPLLAPNNPLEPVDVPLRAPGEGGLLMGTDMIGRDIFSRVLYGARSSWFAALASVALGLLIGGLIGVVAGLSGGWLDALLMRITDGFLALPAPILVIAVVAALGPSLTNTLLAIALVWWPYYARIARSEVRSIVVSPHIDAARLGGVSRWRIATRHVLPGAVPALIVAAGLDVGALILTLSSLSFLGLGQPAPAAELGADAARNLSFFLQQWWVVAMPGLAIAVLALVANAAGANLRGLLAERSRR